MGLTRKGHERTFWGNVNDLYPDSGMSYTCVYTCQNSANVTRCIHFSVFVADVKCTSKEKNGKQRMNSRGLPWRSSG